MTAEGHLLFSVASVVMVHQLQISPDISQGDWLHLIPGALAGALLPDIDHPKSMLGQWVRFISVPVSRLCGHRGFTHSLLAILTGVILFRTQLPVSWSVPADFYQAVIVGYLSHLAGDMLTTAGIPLLWPVRWRFCIPLLGSSGNKRAERSVALIVLLASFYLPAHWETWWAHVRELVLAQINTVL
ncbi:TPA: metal-dependent hydrolase [Morganella morganii]